MTPQEINIERQREEMRKRDMETKQKQMAQQSYIQQLQEQLRQQQQMINSQQEMINQNKTDSMPNSRIEPMAANAKPAPLPPTISADHLRPNIRAPDQVKDILSRIHNMKPSAINPTATETQDDSTSNNDRLVSETTYSESNPKKIRQPRKNAKKSNILVI
jgi:polyribonucleotide nucleotidyltransferase